MANHILTRWDQERDRLNAFFVNAGNHRIPYPSDEEDEDEDEDESTRPDDAMDTPPYSPVYTFASYPTNDNLSMAQSFNTTITPPLTFSTSTTGQTASTSSHASLPHSQYRFEEDGNDPSILLLRAEDQEQPLQCAFLFMRCEQVFSLADKEAWKTHCLAHFRGHGPPKTACCPLCTMLDNYTYGDPYEAWQCRMEHVFQHHHQGETLSRSRADYPLLRYLWSKKILDPANYQDLKMNWGLRLHSYSENVILLNRNSNNRRGPRT